MSSSQRTGSTASSASRGKPSTRLFVLAALAVVLILASGISYYASSQPDGLTKVAADKGFDSQQKSSATADSPFAGYAVKDIANERVSGAVAGATGILLVLALMGGIVIIVRRRAGHEAGTPPDGELSSGQQG
ncbi:MAG: PDGLE domain-containing protein [Nocardioidaceae bacterium]